MPVAGRSLFRLLPASVGFGWPARGVGRPLLVDLLTLPRSAFAAALGMGTALRGARIFHPHGQTRTATVTVEGGSDWGAALLDQPGIHGGLARLSRGAGLPRPLPDVEGLALRLPGMGVDGAPLDLLVNSAWRYAFVPSAVSPTWSAVLPHRTGSGRLVLLGARPEGDGFTMLAASPLGRWQQWGHLSLGTPLQGEDLGFVPTVGAQDLQPVELFRTLRAWSYVASQSARGARRPDAPAVRAETIRLP